MNLDLGVHIVELLAVTPILWKVNRALTRVLDALESFPPHRHAPGGVIVYPKSYEPTALGKMNDSD